MSQDKPQTRDSRPSYKKTLNLLQTNFAMRANSIKREPELQKFWNEKGIDLQLGLNNEGNTFTLHDGPPYANGALHMGHALNKVLKDIINKYKILQGKKVHYIPGWDCHGLPIELKVLQSLNNSERSSLTPLQLREKAASYALKQVEIQKNGFKRWGIWADWENPYLTLNKDYEAAQIKIFGDMALQGYIYRGMKPVHWSPSSRTALAEAELEYPDGHSSQSVYVSFPVVEVKDKLRQELLNQGLQLPYKREDLCNELKLAIWTTTPWTLPANLAISVNSKLNYVFASDEKHRIIVIAQELMQSISNKLDSELKILANVSGLMLEGISYKHPIIDRISKIVIGGDYITTENGTGLVHTAPGHGVDDFNTGKKYGLPVLCPVNEAGILTAEAGRFEGLNVLKDANNVIIEALQYSGSLLKQEKYFHRYPYDWRTKKPTIFRATEQWFASVEGFRDKALHAIEKVDWLPSSGRNRIESMVRDRGDWCISRQRTWGVPIPVFYEKGGDDVLINEETISHIHSLIADHGSDIWWKLDVKELLPPSYSSSAEKWEKGLDTMDVWFDSGTSWGGVLKSRNNLDFPADLYLEGSDQHRGWFQSSLLTSVAVNNQAPYKKVLTHGFALDEKGRKMSKSLGNILNPLDIIEGGNNKKVQPAYGADVLRLWVSSVDYNVDVPIGDNILNQLSDVYRKVRNTARYLLGNLHDFNPSQDSIPIKELPLIDRWMLNRTAEFIQEITISFERYEFSKFFQLLQSYCVIDLSNFYLDIAKDRLYVSAFNEYRRRSCQTVMSLVIETLSGLISPVLCHMAEDIWQNIPYALKEDSVFLRGWPELGIDWRDESINQYMKELRSLRTSVNKVIEESRTLYNLGAGLEAAVRVEIKDSNLQDSLDWLHRHGNQDVDSLADWLLVSQLQIGGEPWAEVLTSFQDERCLVEVARARGYKCDRCWHFVQEIIRSDDSGNLCERCNSILENI